MLLSSCLCRGDDGKPFCLAELWPWRNTPSHFTTSNPTFSNFWAKTSKLYPCGPPFRRIKRTNVQSLHWSFGFIEILQLTPSTRSKIPKKIILVSHTRLLKIISAPQKASHFIGQLWQLTRIPSNIGALTHAWQAKCGFQNPGVCLQAFPSFFPHPFLPHPTPLLRELNWLPVKEQLFYGDPVLTFKCQNDLAPQYLTSKFTKRSNIHTCKTRTRNSLQIPLYRTAIGQRTFSYRGANTWNNLHNELRQSASLTSFKRALKDKLLRQTFPS